VLNLHTTNEVTPMGRRSYAMRRYRSSSYRPTSGRTLLTVLLLGPWAWIPFAFVVATIGGNMSVLVWLGLLLGIWFPWDSGKTPPALPPDLPRASLYGYFD
jgi:hypothetical protein